MSSTDDPIQRLFYAFPKNGRDRNKRAKFDLDQEIPEKYLLLGENRVSDPVPGGSQQNGFYTGLNPDGTINKTSVIAPQKKPNDLVVPANFDLGRLLAFAADVKRSGPVVGGAEMLINFWPGGGWDIQRGKNWGVKKKRETNPAVRDSASWVLGFVTGLSGTSVQLVEIGAGGLKRDESLANVFRTTSTANDGYGPYGMDRQNYMDFLVGVQAATPQWRRAMQQYLEHRSRTVAPLRIRPRFPIRFRGASSSRTQDDSGNTAQTLPDPQVMTVAGRRPGVQNVALGSSSPGGAKLIAPVFAKFRADTTSTVSRGATNVASSSGMRHVMAAAGMLPPSFGNSALHGPVLNTAPARLGLDARKLSASAARRDHAKAVARASALKRTYLPSIAPVRQHSLAEIASPVAGKAEMQSVSRPNASSRAAHAPETAPPRETMPQYPAATRIDDRELSRALSELLDRQGRLPPAGAAGFDPRLTPAWAGQKLPF